MPRINILEDKLTRATGTIGTDIPYIPGFVSKICYEYKLTKDAEKSDSNTYYIVSDTSADGYAQAGETDTDVKKLYEKGSCLTPYAPTLCTSVEQFEALFGKFAKSWTAEVSTLDIAAGEFDRSYLMAKELLKLGMPVYYHAINIKKDATGTSIELDTDNNFYTNLAGSGESGSVARIDELYDLGEYTIKYITSGGYGNMPNTSASTPSAVEEGEEEPTASTSGINLLASKMIDIAATRGDCVALIEAGCSQYTTLATTGTSFYAALQNGIASDNDKYAAAFTPWGEYNIPSANLVNQKMPACFGYLATLASNIKVSPNWLAMAGTTRGLVPNLTKLCPVERLNNKIADSYQPTTTGRAINAITDIKPYGLCIWGNRTLANITNGLDGMHFLNTRNMISDIKKVAYRVAKSLIYEQNNEMLWLNFKSQVAPFLEQLKSGAGIADYKLLKLDTHYNGSSLGKEEFACAIRIIPVYAVESFEITIVISDADVAVE